MDNVSNTLMIRRFRDLLRDDFTKPMARDLVALRKWAVSDSDSLVEPGYYLGRIQSALDDLREAFPDDG
jgi:hypothetical protein